MIKKNYIFLMIVFLFYSISFSDSIDIMREKLSSIEKGIVKSEMEIQQLNKEKDNLIKKLYETEKEYEKIEKEYTIVEKNLIELNRKRDYGEKSLLLINKELESKKEELNNLVYMLYRNSKTIEFDYLFKGESLFDLSRRQKNIGSIIEHQNEIIMDIEDTKKEVISQKVNLEEKTKIIAKERRNLANKKVQLEKAKKDRNNVITKLGEKELEFINNISKLEMEKSEIENRIEEIIKSRIVTTTNYEVKVVREKVGIMQFPIIGDVVVRFDEKKRFDSKSFVESKGLEIKGKLGDRVRASGKGEVIYSDSFPALGHVVMIDHGFGLVSVYGNLLTSLKKGGSIVKKGEIIGVLGLSTTARESILYFELRLNANQVNPMIFLGE